MPITMKFLVCSSLYYDIIAPSTILCSLSCSQTPSQYISHEELSVSRPVARSDLSVGLTKNRLTKLEIGEAGALQVQYSTCVEIAAKPVSIDTFGNETLRALDAGALPYLFPSRYAPADRLRDAAMDLFGHIHSKYEVAMAIEEWLHQNVHYQIGSSDEQSSALDTFERRTGVCRDFAHLGIAFCRALTVPARYCTVYAYQLHPQDFHAVFEVYIAGHWYVVDGTRLAPLNGMIRIATGSDASDAAVATLFGDIVGQGVQVDVQLLNGQDTFFDQVTRQSLRAENKAFSLS